MKKFFSKLFGSNEPPKLSEEAQQVLDIFLTRSQERPGSLSEEDYRYGLNQCLEAARQEDKIYKLPPNYGTALKLGYEAGRGDIIPFVQRALDGGATLGEVEQWWNLNDLLRRMLEWELEVLKARQYQAFIQDYSQADAIALTRAYYPEFTADACDPTNPNAPLPVEMQLWADQVKGQLSIEQWGQIAQTYSSMNAYLRELRIEQAKQSSTDHQEQLGDYSDLSSEQLYHAALENIQTGKFHEAYGYAKELWQQGKKHGFERDVQQTTAMSTLVTAFARVGQYQEAEEILRVHLEVSPTDSQHYVPSLTSLGEVYRELGQYEQAIKTQLRAIKLAQSNHPDEQVFWGRLHNNLGMACVFCQRYSEAIAAYHKSIQLIQYHQEELPDFHSLVCSNLGVAYMMDGQYEKAEEYCLQALELRQQNLPSAHPDIATSIDNLGGVYLGMERYPEALHQCNQAIELRKAQLGDEHPDTLLALGNKAFILTKMGEKEEAIAILEQVSSARLRYIREQFPTLSEEGQKQFYHVLKLDIEGYYDLVAEQPTLERVENLMAIRLMTKGLLLAQIERRNRYIQYFGEHASIQKMNEGWTQLRQQFSDSISNSKIQQGELNEIKDKLGSLEASLNREIALAIKEHYTQSSNSRPINDPWLEQVIPSWELVQQQLKAGEAAVEVIQAFDPDNREPIYLAIAIRPEQGLGFSKLPRSNWIHHRGVQEYRKWVKRHASGQDRVAVSTLSEEEWGDLSGEESWAEELYNSFWKPIQQLLEGANHIYFAGDGAYLQINPGALWDEEKKQYVKNKFFIQHVSSLNRLIYPKPQSSPSALPHVVLLGNPDYMDGVGESTSPKIAPLPGTQQEVEAIGMLLSNQKGFEVTSLLGKEASERQLQETLPARIVHIATHGYFEPVQREKKRSLIVSAEKANHDPLFRSGLLLAGAEKAFQDQKESNDGILTAYEIAGWNLQDTDMVILSACDTASGDVEIGEGVYGVQRSFLAAGAKQLLCSLWPVADEATAKLMTYLYEHWLKEGEFSRAFHKAQMQLRDEYPQPYYWGAFIMIS